MYSDKTRKNVRKSTIAYSFFLTYTYLCKEIINQNNEKNHHTYDAATHH